MSDTKPAAKPTTRPAAKPQSTNSRPVYQTTIPFPLSTLSQWPIITPALQRQLLALLIELLAPVGAWRETVPRSRGKRAARKRKREGRDGDGCGGSGGGIVAQGESTDVGGGDGKGTSVAKTAADVDMALPVPPVARHITVGLNSTSRALEAAAQRARDKVGDANTTEGNYAALAAVFVTHPTESLLYAHLPRLAAAGTARVKLVALPKGAEEKICAALALPRVGMVGIFQDAVGAAALLACVEQVDEGPVNVGLGKWQGAAIEVRERVVHVV